MTRMPLVRVSATFSAACRHRLQRRNSASPSFHSLVERSKNRGVDATVKFATAAPDGVNRSSGSAVRLPTTVMMVSPAMASASGLRGDLRGALGSARLLAADHLGAEHGLLQRQLPVELLDVVRLGDQLEDGVDAFGVLVDLVGQPATTPDVDLLHAATRVADDLEK